MRKRQLLILSLAALAICSCGRKSYDEQLIEQAQEFTEKQCPREVDPCTTIDSMTYAPEAHTIHYYYTLKDKLDDPSIYTESVIEDFREKMLLKVRNDIALKQEKENGITFCYHYRSATSKRVLMTLTFTKADYTGNFTPRSFNYRETRKMEEYSRAQCPIKQDACTTLDSIWYDSIGRMLYYDYTVEGNLDADSIYGPESPITRNLHSQLVKAIRQNEEVKEERDKENVNFAFRYFSKTTGQKLVNEVIKNKEVRKKQK